MSSDAERRFEGLFQDMLDRFPAGLSSTSTRKFDDTRRFFGELLGIEPSDIYAVGAGTRPGNLEVRLSQGVQATKHTALGLGFIKADSDEAADRLSDSALVTIEKFLNRGKASYEAIGIVVAQESELNLKRVLELPESEIGQRLKEYFPGVEVRKVKGTSSPEPPLDGQVPLEEELPTLFSRGLVDQETQTAVKELFEEACEKVDQKIPWHENHTQRRIGDRRKQTSYICRLGTLCLMRFLRSQGVEDDQVFCLTDEILNVWGLLNVADLKDDPHSRTKKRYQRSQSLIKITPGDTSKE